MLTALVLIVVLANLALAAPPNLVPAVSVVDANNKGFILQPNEYGYQLGIKGRGGSLVQNVEVDDDGELNVQGVFKQKFENNLKLIVKYIAGNEGYYSSYKLRLKVKKKKKQPTPKPQPIPDLPDDDDDDKPFVLTNAIKIECLRSCAG
ncbi:hypothetical protein KR093_003395 [Drosophila rubida]|uniref:Uncharacterized protein n=1 Tax=Drosophila rubida TaxID=30044 RepID=A0AAD4PMK0_9MUSC|nr:hypothetical protein KR093_003395 [Drosophila rubida]